MKLGMIGETIVNLIFTYDRIPLPCENTAVRRIDTLFREGMISRDLVDILHALRKIRNKAVHENYSSVDDGKAGKRSCLKRHPGRQRQHLLLQRMKESGNPARQQAGEANPKQRRDI